MDILSYLKEHTLLLDGAMGSQLLALGMKRDERSEQWTLTHPEAVKGVHRAYFDAGCNAVITDTFGANRLYHNEAELREIVFAAVRLAREAAAESTAPQEKFVGLDIGPCGRLIEPLGEFNFDEAKDLFAQVVRLGAEAGVDFVFIETMYDLGETRAAVSTCRRTFVYPSRYEVGT